MNLQELLMMRKQAGSSLPQTAVPQQPSASRLVPALRTVSMATTSRNTPCAVPIAELPAEAAGKARERLTFVLAVRNASASRGISLENAVEWVRNRYMENYPLLAQGGKHGVSTLTYSSYRNWSPCVPKHYNVRDEAVVLQRLADGYRRGRQEVQGPPAFWKYLCAVWLSSHRLPMSKAYDIAVKRLRKDDPALVPPTINQAKYYLARIDKAIVAIGRDGGTAFKNMFVDYIERDWSAILPGDMVVGDSRTFDTRCKVWDEAAQKWIGVRPTICALMDAASNYFAAWTITPDPVDANSIANTLGLYCNLYGIPPRYAYFDNGKDYTARGFSTPLVIAGEEFSIFRELHIAMTNSIAYNARAKTIEREFANMMRGFDKTMPDYLGSKPGQRTMDAEWYDKHPEDLPSLQQFIQAFSDWLKDFHDTPQKSIILEGRTPAEVWDSRPRYEPWSDEALARAFQRPIGLRRVMRGPGVTLAGRRFIADELHVNDNVIIKMDPVEEDRVHCYTPDGAFICTAYQREKVPALAVADDDRDLLSRLVARQRHQMKKALTMLQDLTGGLHLLSPFEILNASPDSEVVRLGTIGSVKGREHRYTKYALASSEQTPLKPQPQPRQPDEEPDTELQKLINESRHSFAEDQEGQDILRALQNEREEQQDADAAPVSIRQAAIAMDEVDDDTHVSVRAAFTAVEEE